MKSALLTRQTSFGQFNYAGGITLDASLETASNLTEGVIDIAKGVACRIGRADGAAELWAGIHALESVAAILEAIQAGLLDLERPEPTAAPWDKPDPADDPEVLRRTWTDLAEMAADQLAKLEAGKSSMQIDAALVRAYLYADAQDADAQMDEAFRQIETNLHHAIIDGTGIDGASLRTYGQIVIDDDGLLLLGQGDRRVLRIDADGRVTWLDAESSKEGAK